MRKSPLASAPWFAVSSLAASISGETAIEGEARLGRTGTARGPLHQSDPDVVLKRR